MGKPEIVVVSHARAGTLTTLDLFDDPSQPALCIPASQEADYRRHHPEARYVIHPDSVRGLPAKRQWIFEQFGDVFMLDDDVVRVHDNTLGPADTRTEIRGDRIVALIQRAHDTAEQLGIKLYGFGPQVNPTFYNPQRPFRLTGLVFGSCFGMVREGSKLWFDTNVVAVDDMWISLLNVHFHRYALVDLRYSVHVVETGKRAGGNAVYRTKDTYRHDVAYLQGMFGEKKIAFTEGGNGLHLDVSLR